MLTKKEARDRIMEIFSPIFKKLWEDGYQGYTYLHLCVNGWGEPDFRFDTHSPMNAGICTWKLLQLLEDEPELQGYDYQVGLKIKGNIGTCDVVAFHKDRGRYIPTLHLKPEREL